VQNQDGPPVLVVSKEEGGGEKRKEVKVARQLKLHV
jgi:hypothetical protein